MAMKYVVSVRGRKSDQVRDEVSSHEYDLAFKDLKKASERALIRGVQKFSGGYMHFRISPQTTAEVRMPTNGGELEMPADLKMAWTTDTVKTAMEGLFMILEVKPDAWGDIWVTPTGLGHYQEHEIPHNHPVH